MACPIKLNAHRIAREYGFDVDIVMTWSLTKFYEHLAFFYLESEAFKESQKTPIEFDEIVKRMEQQGAKFKDG
jgi:hypothetical protein